MPKTKRRTKRRDAPRAVAARGEIIDVEAEPVVDERPRPERPPIVVEIETAPGRAIPVVESAAAPRTGVQIAAVQGVVRDIEHAVEVGDALGRLLRRLFR